MAKLWDIKQLQTKEYRDQRLQGADFSGQRIDHPRFFGCSFDDCRFDGAVLQDLRMWRTTFKDCSFRSASLRNAALGVQDGLPNRFERVDFSKADLRGAGAAVAEFSGCLFHSTRLDKVDFQGSRFKDCVFSGKLNEVIFQDHAFDHPEMPANEMDNVDFGDAELRWVEFRRLDLKRITPPRSKQHIIVPGYRGFLERAIAALNPEIKHERILKGMLEFRLKWAGRQRDLGIINELDIVEESGQAGLDRLKALLPS